MKPIFLILLAVLWSANLHAHSGRTNSEGCHNDNKRGGYHCHGGGSSSAARSSTVVPQRLTSAPTIQSDGSIPYDFYECVDDIHVLAQTYEASLARNTNTEYSARLRRHDGSSQLIVCYASHRKKVIEE